MFYAGPNTTYLQMDSSPQENQGIPEWGIPQVYGIAAGTPAE